MTTPKVPRIDLHVHSEFSPCSLDTSIQRILPVAESRGLEKIAITDHGTESRPRWISNYFSGIERARRETSIDVLTGMEVNIDTDGTLAVHDDILRSLDVVIGAVHHLPIMEVVRKKSIFEEYRTILLRALETSSFMILAHPTALLWNKHIPEDVADDLTSRLRKKGVAVEMNYNHKDPPLEFLRRCVKAGVEITPSSDAHRLSDIGHFDWYEKQLAQLDETVTWIRI